MRIFVTGGTGFIGRHLVKKLTGQKHELRLLSRNPKKHHDLESETTKFISGNLSDIAEWKDEVKEFNPQAAIHLAWEGIPDYSSAASTKNLVQGINLYSVLAETDCKKIISTGSGWEYGLQKGGLTETLAIHPHNAFAAAKLSLYWTGKHLAEERGIQFDWLRLFYVYGPGQREGALIPYIIHCIKEGKTPEIKTPSVRNDFIYVDDVVEAIAAVLAEGTVNSEKHASDQKYPSNRPVLLGSVYNVGSGVLTSVGEIINLVHGHLGRETKITNAEERPKIAYDGAWADLTRIKEKTGWEPKVDIEGGILRMITAGESHG